MCRPSKLQVCCGTCKNSNSQEGIAYQRSIHRCPSKYMKIWSSSSRAELPLDRTGHQGGSPQERDETVKRWLWGGLHPKSTEFHPSQWENRSRRSARGQSSPSFIFENFLKILMVPEGGSCQSCSQQRLAWVTQTFLPFSFCWSMKALKRLTPRETKEATAGQVPSLYREIRNTKKDTCIKCS